jgi:hypothetical protein
MPSLYTKTTRSNTLIKLLIFIIALSLFSSCKKSNDVAVTQNKNAEIAIQWADMTLATIKASLFKSPTYSSRSLGYLGLTMYECIVHSDPTLRSMSGQLNGLNNLPLPSPGVDYYWSLALNAGQDTLLKLLYPLNENLGAINTKSIDSLANLIALEERKTVSSSVATASEKIGIDIALAIYNWSLTDGGHKGFNRNFDPNFVFPSGPSYWVPPVAGQTVSRYPLHPFWGNNRTFIPANSIIPVPAIVPYSNDPSSAYYKLYNDVYVKNKILTDAEKNIAAWWADDPSETFSPPGHSYNLTTIAIKNANASLAKAAEAYARTGMAVADAFINCWKAKVTYFNERPSSFVRANIDATWKQYWPEPPFPAFPSGHSTQGAAAATVLTDVFGDNFSFSDNSHTGEWRYVPVAVQLNFTRSFNSFWDMAVECAYSRFLGGIHTVQDNQTGLDEGKLIGQNVNKLNWRK